MNPRPAIQKLDRYMKGFAFGFIEGMKHAGRRHSVIGKRLDRIEMRLKGREATGK